MDSVRIQRLRPSTSSPAAKTPDKSTRAVVPSCLSHLVLISRLRLLFPVVAMHGSIACVSVA